MCPFLLFQTPHTVIMLYTVLFTSHATKPSIATVPFEAVADVKPVVVHPNRIFPPENDEVDRLFRMRP